MCVSSAGKNTGLSQWVPNGFAAIIARQLRDAETGRTMKKGSAKSVERNLRQTNTQSKERAPENADVFFVPVVSVKSVGFEPVYNLEVDELHNFAVNGGIIVHNCMDALRYYINSLPDWRFDVVQTK